MLNLTNISLRRGSKILLQNVTFQLHAGQRMGLIGANGSGKTSFFSMLLGELEPDDGELGLHPKDVIAHVAQESPHGSGAAIDYVMDGDTELRAVQSAIADHEAGNTAGEAALHSLHERMEAIDGFSAEARAARLLHGLGFASAEIRKPVREFSGGWRMRLNLARALMCRSDILLLDEPTNHLDLPAILWLERWLRRYDGLLLVVSHDRDFLDQVCTRVAHIEHERITQYTGNYSQFESQRAEQLAQQQGLYARQQKDIAHMQSFVDRFRYKASKARQAQSRLKMLERMQTIAPAHVDSPFRFHFIEPRKQPQHLLSLIDTSVGYVDGDRTDTVLSGIDINLSAGDRVGLLGVNGAGKSTLVKALAAGSTMLDGERVISKDTKIGYFAQHQLELLIPEQSPIDHLRVFAPGDREQDLRNFLGRFGFSGERIFEPVAPFSGGEKARLVLALMIRQQPNLLLLDEPTNHLDLEMRQALSVALIEYTGALVVISHDRHLLRSVCDELLIVHDGRVEQFKHSLDEYPAWIKEQELGQNQQSSETGTSGPTKRVNKKQQRQDQAQRRERLKPLYDKIRDIEKQLANGRSRLESLNEILADESIYVDAERKGEVSELVQEQAAVRADIEGLEWSWLEVSEKLESSE
jgi:ATP-binding cassette subfamily F protein 3